MPKRFLCSYAPLSTNSSGRTAVQRAGLPPFIDGSCRREPDFQAAFPSISALCRRGKFAPRLATGDRVAYITRQGQYAGESGWSLVALLRVLHRFESHEAAATWYRAQGVSVPSNCIVHGNNPQPFELTHQIAPPDVLARCNAKLHPERIVRLWDVGYAKVDRWVGEGRKTG